MPYSYYDETHAKSRKDSCTNNVHPDVILDADEALRNILGRLTKLEDEVAPIKTENKELKKRNGYLDFIQIYFTPF